MPKKEKSSGGLVYSTDPNFKIESHSETIETLIPGEQRLKVSLDKKQRAGKIVTLIKGFQGKEEDLELLGKKLKAACGTGGSAKEGEIIIQGDHVQKVVQWLVKNGYVNTK